MIAALLLASTVESVLFFGFWVDATQPSYPLITFGLLTHLPGFLLSGFFGDPHYWPLIGRQIFDIGANIFCLWPFFAVFVWLLSKSTLKPLR